jgi:hypothetical protein
VYNILIEERAILEIDSASEYYASLPVNSKKIIADFLNEINQKINFLKINPNFQIKIKNYRSIPLRKFPFIIFFLVDESSKTVRILSIFNTHQNTNKYPQTSTSSQ